MFVTNKKSSGGIARPTMTSSGSLSNPQAGDLWTIVTPPGVEASDFSMMQDRGSGPVSLALTAGVHTVTAADISPAGYWPVTVRDLSINLVSLPINTGSPPRAPDAPTIGTATAGNGQAAVLFTAPANNGGSPITSYQVYAQGNDGSTLGPKTAVVSPMPFTGLTNGVSYTFRVLAVNAIGPGPLSAASNAVTPVAVAADPFMFASMRTLFPVGQGSTVTAGNGIAQQIDEIYMPPVPYDQKAPRCVYTTIKVDSTGEAPPAAGTAIPVLRTWILVGGVKKFTKTAGADTATIPLGGFIITDADDSIVIPANTPWWAGVYTVLPVNGFRPSNGFGLDTLDHQRRNGGDISGFANGASPISGLVGYGAAIFAPCAVFAKGWKTANDASVAANGYRIPVHLVTGDSILYGSDDTTAANASEGIYGYVCRSLADNVSSRRMAHSNFGAPGIGLLSLSASQFAIREQIIRAANNNSGALPFTNILDEMGINTTPGSRIAQFEGTAGPYLRTYGVPITQLTMTPYGTPLGNSFGVDNSPTYYTPFDNSAFNNYIKGGTSAYIDSFIDVTPIFESSPGSNRLRLPSPQFSSTLAAAAASGDFSIKLNAAPPLRSMLVIQPFNANGRARSVFSSTDNGDGTFTAGLFTSVGAAMAAGTVVTETYSQDDLHHAPLLAQLASSGASAPIIVAKNAGNTIFK